MYLEVIQGTSLESAFGDNWEMIYELDENADFRRSNLDPQAVSRGSLIYSPWPTQRSCWLKEVGTSEEEICSPPTRVEFLKKVIPPAGICAEIGVQRGYFSQQILKFASPKHLYLIDNWEVEKDDQQKENYKHVTKQFSGMPNITIIRKHSTAVQFEDNSLDWVYLDADHTYPFVIEDIKFYLPKVKEGGIIAGHDYCIWGRYGVIQAVNESVKQYDLKFVALTTEFTASYALLVGNH